jgi:DNA-binding MarR family transcriptional regulator
MSRGVKFGRKRNYTQFQVEEVILRKSQGQGLGTIGKSLGMTRSMVQRIVKNELQPV